ncbi:MAG: ThiF family adenylyltransferase [Verrucomicrobiae bacterium]|nr:ThiF family adenylyltransferase [Verrucomicrobiae bacterium]
MAISFVDLLPPGPGDLDRRSSIVEFRSEYILRAQLVAEKDSLGIGVVHSHPRGCGVGPSSLDDDMDAYFAEEFPAYTTGAPYVSLIFSCDVNREVYFSGRAFDRGTLLKVREILTVGQPLRRESSASTRTTAETREHSAHRVLRNLEGLNARLQSLVGATGAARLSSAKVAIVGCSGTGSPMAHTLVRAGIRTFVLIDPQRLAPSNLERLHGSNALDLEKQPPPYKVAIVGRLIREIAPDAEVTRIVGNILDEEVLDELLTCDLVLGCTDTQHSRVFLGDLASHYLLPSMDVGVRMRAKAGVLTEQVAEIAAYEPGYPCPHCQGRIDQAALTEELIDDAERIRRRHAAAEAEARGEDGRQYWGGPAPQEMTVGYQTAAVANLAAGYAIGWLTGASRIPHRRFQFDPGMPCLGVTPADGQHQSSCTCLSTLGRSDEARADRGVSRPNHWLPCIFVPEDVVNVWSRARFWLRKASVSCRKIPVPWRRCVRKANQVGRKVTSTLRR